MPTLLSKVKSAPFFSAKKHDFRDDFIGLSRRGKCITGVTIVTVNGNKQPKLQFDDARLESTESPTEDEFAGVLRTTYHDKTRPEFVFRTIAPPNPLAGRQYCDYSPTWMRGTRLGKLTIEADVWMKSLATNVKPLANCVAGGGGGDGEGSRFVAWNQNTCVRGMKTSDDFPREERSGSIFLKCANVEFSETDDALVFPNDPIMKIESTASPKFGAYLSNIYDDVVFDGASVFERVRELPKMIVIAEWLKEKGVEIDEEWLWEKTQSNPSIVPETFQRVKSSAKGQTSVVPVKQKADFDLRQMMNRVAERDGREVLFGRFGPIHLETKYEITNYVVDGSRHSADVVTKIGVAGVAQPLFQFCETVRASVSDDDLDWIYEGLNPWSPIDGSFSLPNVKSWSELHEQSIDPFCNIIVPRTKARGWCDISICGGGGCSMKSFSTQHVPNGTRQPYRPPPTPEPSVVPSSCPVGGVRGGQGGSTIQIGGTANLSDPGSARFSDPTGVPVYNGVSARYSIRPRGEGNMPVIAWGTVPTGATLCVTYCAICKQYLNSSSSDAAATQCGHACHEKVQCFSVIVASQN